MIERPKSNQPIPEHATRVFDGELFEVYQWEQELFDGSSTTFEKVKRKHDAACVIPILPDGKFVITYDEQPGRVPLITFPGGRIEDDESPDEGALRELAEETGYHTDTLEYWYGFQPNTKMDYAVYNFIARDCVNGSSVHMDAGERITLRIVDFDELIELALEPNFQGKDFVRPLLEAKYNPEKKAELKRLFRIQ